METEEKLKTLHEIFQSPGHCVVAFSGGVDSTFLLAAAIRSLGAENVIAVTAVSATLTREEKAEAQALGRRLGVKHVLLETREFDDEKFTANTPDRCYHCKKIRFHALIEWAAAQGISCVVEGSNVDDEGDYRPGARAVAELAAARSPLIEVGLTKAEIRAISNDWQLSTAGKLSNACLATRLEYGLKITEQRLKQIEEAEAFLRPMVEGPLRVRHHGNLARIEVNPAGLAGLAVPGVAATLADRLKKNGFSYVTLDLCGYRMGSMNQGIK